MEEEDVRGDRGLSVFRLRAVSRLTLVVRCTEIGYSVSTQVLGFRFGCGWCCVVGFLFGCCWFCVLLLCVSAWWNRGFADEVTMASYGRAVTGTAVMARSAKEEKKKNDHICHNCEQRILFPERIPKWEMQKLPICDLWCRECATQRCCTRGPHQHHLHGV